MPRNNIYIENSERWRLLAQIDYFTQFVKAWVPFNAWYRNFFPNFDSDKEAMEHIKTGSNAFKDKLLSLIDGVDIECLKMKNYIADLHYQLERKYILAKNDVRITFTGIVIEANPNCEEILKRNGITYECKRDRNNQKNISNKVTNRKCSVLFSYSQINGYNLEEVLKEKQYQQLSPSMQGNFKTCYCKINPYIPENLLNYEPGDELIIGKFRFLNDKEKLAKGIIQILYLLRNALFHGEIIPDRETQNVYEPAYHILRMLVETLG